VEDILRAIVLGIVQGLTEFLPISSSGHLIVVRDLFGWEFTDDLTFDVALHLGTTAAVAAYFWREWLSMARSVLSRVFLRERTIASESVYDTHLLLLVILGSVPVAVIGLAFESTIEDEFRSRPVLIGAMLVAFGLVLFLAERLSRRERSLGDARWPDALVIGAAQSLALIPGVSRSGITITAALGRRFTRQEAARFSFLLSTPAIAGAGLLKLGDALRDGTLGDELDIIIAGAVVSAVAGWLSIGLLMRLVQSRSYVPFVAYRVLAGLFIIAYFA
jgi:undecaprenyl-diphosphatase